MKTVFVCIPIFILVYGTAYNMPIHIHRKPSHRNYVYSNMPAKPRTEMRDILIFESSKTDAVNGYRNIPGHLDVWSLLIIRGGEIPHPEKFEDNREQFKADHPATWNEEEDANQNISEFNKFEWVIPSIATLIGLVVLVVVFGRKFR